MALKDSSQDLLKTGHETFFLQYPILHGENVAENPQNKMLGIMHFMNKQLGATGYVARTDNLSVADLAAYATVSTIKVGAYVHTCFEGNL